MSTSIPASVPPPAPPAGFQGKGGPRALRAAKERKYGTPLPILLPSSPLHPCYNPSGSSSSFTSLLSTGILTKVVVPQCTGIFDAASASVWVEDPAEMETLFNRGFFGKGTLSRSDPNWRARRVELAKGGSALAAEQIREKRRQERKQFKIDRAAAMLEAAKKAEAVITSGVLPEGVALVADGPVARAAVGTAEAEAEAEAEEEEELRAEAEGEDVEGPPRAPSPTPSAATTAATDYTALLPDGTKITAQTFLVRPTRPDANRNRGKKAFKRRPPPPATGATATGDAPTSASVPAPAPAPAPPPAPVPEPEEESDSGSDDELIQEMEHLQLSLQEAWFLSAIGVLKIRNGRDGEIVPYAAVLPLFLTPTLPRSAPPATLPTPATALYPDDPLFVSYAAYHHYRSLGWCVRDGIKFCVDWLLYRRGPVFSHSVFSVVTVPVYMQPGDQHASPYGVTDWYAERMSWKWMNTVMRVNSLVQKTIIICYITIPAIDSFPESARLPGGGLDPRKYGMKDLMARYSVREVSLMRFGPARRRD